MLNFAPLLGWALQKYSLPLPQPFSSGGAGTSAANRGMLGQPFWGWEYQREGPNRSLESSPAGGETPEEGEEPAPIPLPPRPRVSSPNRLYTLVGMPSLVPPLFLPLFLKRKESPAPAGGSPDESLQRVFSLWELLRRLNLV